MPAYLGTLLQQVDFDLSLLTDDIAAATVTDIEWVHNSDLEDPSPFLESGHMLLTTGRQFLDVADKHFYQRYVERLVDSGVVALGFGTEVVRDGTPVELVAACNAARLPLVEIPYRTPFIAISQWVGEVRATDARTRLDWALAAQNAVSLAALGNGGLSAAVGRAAAELSCTIDIVDPAGEIIVSHTAAHQPVQRTSEAWLNEVSILLRAQRRARIVLTSADEVATFLTLGGSQQLRGVMVVHRSMPFDSAEAAVITTLTALAEVSLEHSQDQRTTLRSLMNELFVLLKAGNIDAVRKAVGAIGAGFPGTRFLVVELDIGDAAPSLRESLERRASNARDRLFVAGTAQSLTLLLDQRTWSSVRDRVRASGARAGVSSLIGWDQLSTGLVQAIRALDRSSPSEITEFSELVRTSFFGLLSSASVAEVARARLAPLTATPAGGRLLDEAAEWLRQNGQWEPAARILGIHRHTLKARIASLEKQLGLQLGTFQDRAELWALLAAANPTSDTHVEQ